MSRLCALEVGALFLFAISSVHANDDARFSNWLGPQANVKTSLISVLGKPIDRTKHDQLSRYDMSLEVVQGRDLKLPVSQNATVTFEGTEFRQVKDFRPDADADAKYLVCQIQLKADELGWRFYSLNARVTGGELKGAIVHFRDGKIQDNIRDPCVAVYKVPDVFQVECGKVPFEIVALSAK